jgi:hypothetical protein
MLVFSIPVSLSHLQRKCGVKLSEPRAILEIKYRPSKAPLEWVCELIDGEAGKWARVRYVSDVPTEIEGVSLPVGTVTEGVYWTDRPYHVWKFTTPDGKHGGYRFDICTATYIWEQKLIWYDLELDLCVPPCGSARWQDEDDMKRLVRMEHLSQEELAIANNAKVFLENSWQLVVTEAFGEVLC